MTRTNFAAVKTIAKGVAVNIVVPVAVTVIAIVAVEKLTKKNDTSE